MCVLYIIIFDSDGLSVYRRRGRSGLAGISFGAVFDCWHIDGDFLFNRVYSGDMGTLEGKWNRGCSANSGGSHPLYAGVYGVRFADIKGNFEI